MSQTIIRLTYSVLGGATVQVNHGNGWELDRTKVQCVGFAQAREMIAERLAENPTWLRVADDDPLDLCRDGAKFEG